MKNIHTTGFSLVELMIVVAIIAILGAVAVPSYNQHVTNSRRAQATVTLTQLFNNYQSYYATNNTYSGAPDPTQFNATSTYSTYYNLSVSNLTAGTFTLTATPTFSDPGCTSLSINQSGVQTSTGTATTTTCWAGQ